MIKCVIMFLFLFPKNQKGTKKMQCLMTYKWVKLLRSHLPEGKGLMGYWAKLASHAAFRKGRALYCGHYNRVDPGMWSGGMVGLKRILGLKSRQSVIDVMNKLMDLGFITYTIDAKTKKLEYFLCDWIENCSGEACLGVTAYAIDQYGFTGYEQRRGTVAG